MSKCIKCGSYAFNLHKDDIDQGALCDVHYWQGRANRAEAKQEQGEPVAMRYDFDGYGYKYIDSGSGSDWQTRIKDAEPVYTTPQQRTWVGLTDEEIDAEADKEEQAYGFIQGVAWAEAKLKEKNNGFT